MSKVQTHFKTLLIMSHGNLHSRQIYRISSNTNVKQKHTYTNSKHTFLKRRLLRPGMFDVSPLSRISGLSFDSTLLSPLLFFCLVLLPFLSYRFLPVGPFSKLFPENSSIFFVKRQAFLYGSCLAVRRRQLVGAMCSMLVFVVMHLYNILEFFIASVHSFFYTLFKIWYR